LLDVRTPNSAKIQNTTDRISETTVNFESELRIVAGEETLPEPFDLSQASPQRQHLSDNNVIIPTCWASVP
jgi:hypothetical protein